MPVGSYATSSADRPRLGELCFLPLASALSSLYHKSSLRDEVSEPSVTVRQAYNVNATRKIAVRSGAESILGGRQTPLPPKLALLLDWPRSQNGSSDCEHPERFQGILLSDGR